VGRVIFCDLLFVLSLVVLQVLIKEAAVMWSSSMSMLAVGSLQVAVLSAALLMCKKKKKKPKVVAALPVPPKASDSKPIVDTPKLEEKKDELKKKVDEQKKSIKEKAKSAKEELQKSKSKSKKEVKELSAKKDVKSDKKEKSQSKKSDVKDVKDVSAKLEEKKEKSKKDGSKKERSKKDTSAVLVANKAKEPADKDKDEEKEDEKAEEKPGSKKEADSKKDDGSKKDGGSKKENVDAEPKDGSKVDVPKDEVQKTQMTVIPVVPKELTLDPKMLRFSTDGGTLKLGLVNNTGNRLAVKIKCSDNELYRINPVFSLVDKDGKFEVDVVRVKGTAKPDKLAVVYTEALADATDAQVVFKSSPPADKITTADVPMLVS